MCGRESTVRVHIVNPSDLSFGVAVITPRWMFVLAGAMPNTWGDPILTDETLEPFDPSQLAAGDVVGIGIHTKNTYRGYQLGQAARERGAWVVFGGIHASLFPDEARGHGVAHAVVTGDADRLWARVLSDCAAGAPEPLYEGGRVAGPELVKPRWDLIDRNRYAWASVQTVRGCPKHCSFCSVWRTDGQEPRLLAGDGVLEEIVELRRMGFRFILLADDNFYPVTLEDLAQARRRSDPTRLRELEALRTERFELMERLALLPSDLCFYTQITMEAAEDPAFLQAMRKARIKGALVGIESVTPDGLKDVHKGFNLHGEALVTRLRQFRANGVHVLGSFIFGLPSDRPQTFVATAEIARRAQIDFAQFVTLQRLPGTLDFDKWERETAGQAEVNGVPVSRYWLIPASRARNVVVVHPVMSPEEIRRRTQWVWDQFYSLPSVWRRSRVMQGLCARLGFLLMSKLYRQMYANTGLAADSARESKANRRARWLAYPVRWLFQAKPMPDLEVPETMSAPKRPPRSDPKPENCATRDLSL